MEVIMRSPCEDKIISLVVSSQNRRNAERHIIKQGEPGYRDFEPNIRAYYDPHDMATIRYIDKLLPYITVLRVAKDEIIM